MKCDSLNNKKYLVTVDSLKQLHSHLSEDDIKKMAMEFSKQFEVKKNEIDSDIKILIERLVHCDPLKTLARATDLVMLPMINIVSEFQLSSEHPQTVRYIEYVQSLYISHKLDNQDIITDDKYISETLAQIEKIYVKTQSFIYYWAARALVEHEYSYDEIDYITDSYLMRYVRGKRYQFQQIKIIKSLIAPHSDIFFTLYSLTVDDIIYGLEKLENSLSSGKIEAFNQFANEFKKFDSSDGDCNQQIHNTNDIQSVVGKLFGYALYDVKEVTGWPDSFIKDFSFELGELSGVTEPRNNGYVDWPIVDLPVQKKPFIIIDGVSYCFDYYNLFDNIYRMIQKNIKEKDSTYVTKWSNLQQAASENLVADMIRKLLPEAEVYIGNYYHNADNSRQFDENDILVIYDTCVLIIEVKAGSYVYTPAITDFKGHENSLKTLIEKADYQCNRTLKYINQNEISNFFVSNSKKSDVKFSLERKQFDNFFTFCVTVDNFNDIEAKIEKTNFLKISNGTIAISIDDLDIYTEYFDSPLIFLHYLAQRQAATRNDKLYLNDELDHLGMYIKYNDYSNLKMIDACQGLGFRYDLDAYFAGKHNKELTINRPEQSIPSMIKQLFNFLENNKTKNRVNLAKLLLDMGTDSRQNFQDTISTVIAREERGNKIIPFSMEGTFNNLICVIKIPNMESISEKELLLLGYSLLRSRNKERALYLVLSYSAEKLITDVIIRDINYGDLGKDGFIDYDVLAYMESKQLYYESERNSGE